MGGSETSPTGRACSSVTAREGRRAASSDVLSRLNLISSLVKVDRGATGAFRAFAGNRQGDL
jgi:hypothetical protein